MDLDQLLLPGNNALSLESLHLDEEALWFFVVATTEDSVCPKCHALSIRVHSQYRRTLSDLPCCESTLRLVWQVRRFFCDNPICEQKTFAEQCAAVADRYARRTRRLQERLGQLGHETGGQAGHRVLDMFDISVSRDTILRLVRNGPETEIGSPRIIGIDDWALQKGHTYGTVIVDHERGEVIDLLPDREPETIAKWLTEHPDVEIVTRDRGKNYIDGVTLGAPEVTQVADRFHLLQNLTDTLKRMFDRCRKELKAAQTYLAQEQAQPVEPEPPCQVAETDVTSSVTPDDVHAVPETDTSSIGPPETVVDNVSSSSYREHQFHQVKNLHTQGLSFREIAKQVDLDRRVVKKYVQADSYEQIRPVRRKNPKILPYLEYLQEQWQAGQRNVKQLWLEVCEMGFTGSYSAVWREMGKYIDSDPDKHKVKTQPPRPISPSQASWILSLPPESLTEKQERIRKALCEASATAATAYTLAKGFRQMIQDRNADVLDGWLDKAEAADIAEFHNFAQGLRADYAAVKSALQLSWSNGPTEGHVNRLKMLKRQMYGRAKLDLLRKRILGWSTAGQPNNPITEFA